MSNWSGEKCLLASNSCPYINSFIYFIICLCSQPPPQKPLPYLFSLQDYVSHVQELISAITAEPKGTARIAHCISATNLEPARRLASPAVGGRLLKPCVKSSPAEATHTQALLLPEDWLQNVESTVSCANMKQGNGKWWAMCYVV